MNTWIWGSSPRVRGKRTARSHARANRRLIPARAGKTHVQFPLQTQHSAHPRACGENFIPVQLTCFRLGSSPRVRGKHTQCIFCTVQTWLIPARAGKTQRGATRWSPCAAHPRACGENSTRASSLDDLQGSSPRVRGKPIIVPAAIVGVGLIPARAGKTYVHNMLHTM